MRYYVIRVEFNTVANAENREIFGYDTLDEAKSKFHNIMASDIRNVTLNRALSVIIDQNGERIKFESWEREESEEELA